MSAISQDYRIIPKAIGGCELFVLSARTESPTFGSYAQGTIIGVYKERKSKQILIPLPDLIEQHKIAEILTALDALLSSGQKL